LVLLPSPLYIVLPYCRYNPLLSLLSLISTAVSSYVLYYLPKTCRTPLGLYLPGLNALLATLVAVSGYVKHRPWKGYDYLWILPVVAVITVTTVRRWMVDTGVEITRLRRAKYKLKGA